MIIKAEFKVGDRVMFYGGLSIVSGSPYRGEIVAVAFKDGEKVYQVDAWNYSKILGSANRKVWKRGTDLIFDPA